MLTSPTARALYDECWEETAAEMVGKLRTIYGRQPQQPRMRELVARLDRESDLFRRVWRQHEVSTCVQGNIKTLRHRLGGVMRMRNDAVTVHSSPDQVIYIMIPLDDAFGTAYRKHSGRPLGPGGGRPEGDAKRWRVTTVRSEKESSELEESLGVTVGAQGRPEEGGV
jgi:hypothetical protein